MAYETDKTVYLEDIMSIDDSTMPHGHSQRISTATKDPTSIATVLA